MPRSGMVDISSRWICRWRIAGCCATPASSASRIDRSQTSSASSTSEFGAGSPGLEVPQPPHGAHHQRLDEQRHHVMVVGKAGVDPPHLGGIGVVPLLEFLRASRDAASGNGGPAPRSIAVRPRWRRAALARASWTCSKQRLVALSASASPCSFQVRL